MAASMAACFGLTSPHRGGGDGQVPHQTHTPPLTHQLTHVQHHDANTALEWRCSRNPQQQKTTFALTYTGPPK
eukprot:NODE_4376_length_669_cov_14.016129_g3733_i0.p1 GENE.NODE_4376_length_669_cov_14.016129_g3733_i0~~NODE_4376_length_669_cov_14.016129_g3733_i0.p1  ORF type:complete len:73 (-),score=0.53 NODE_4376_length_669_cov_14.016129_g3733_i0:42-260(-)